MKKLIIIAVSILLISAHSTTGWAKMDTKSKDIDIQFLGYLRTFPTFMNNIDFNSEDTPFDRLGDENGYMSDHNIRNEARVGWTGKGENWDMLFVLEADFTLCKNTVDRSLSTKDDATQEANFGLERLHLTYNFGPFAVQTGWNVKGLDILTGGFVYADDHPYIGFTGKIGNDFTWDAYNLIIQDDLYNSNVQIDKDVPLDPKKNKYHSDYKDWRVYALKGVLKKGTMSFSPFYAFSDNDEEKTSDARIHYIGFEAYGKIELTSSLAISPSFEIAYATGSTDKNGAGVAYDIGALACFGAVELNISKEINPYIGFNFQQGDSDHDDGDIEAFNSITNIARFTPTFGMENAFIYRTIPVLGSLIYSNNFNYLPTVLKGAGKLKANTTPTAGYGGIANTSSGDGSGLVMIGAGIKGTIDELSYKGQVLYFQFHETGALEDITGIKDISKDMGVEIDFNVTYTLSNHFKLGNTLSVFVPGGGVEDIWGDDFNAMGCLDTLELVWTW